MYGAVAGIGPNGKRKGWAEAFEDTPLHQKALALEEAKREYNRQDRIESRLDRAMESMEEAELLVAKASLENQLQKQHPARFKKLFGEFDDCGCCFPSYSARPGEPDPWLDAFRGTPLLPMAQAIRLEEVERAVKQEARWRKGDADRVQEGMISIAMRELEVELFRWKLAEETGAPLTKLAAAHFVREMAAIKSM